MTFDTKLPKRPTSITGLSGLDEYGGNLALVLRNILDNPEARHQFTGLVKGHTPFVRDVGVQRLVDRSVLLRI